MLQSFRAVLRSITRVRFHIRSFCSEHCSYFAKFKIHIWNRMKIRVKESGRTGFPRAGKAAPCDFHCALPSENPSEQPCQSSDNPVRPFSFTWINPISRLFSNSAKVFKKWENSSLYLDRKLTVRTKQGSGIQYCTLMYSTVSLSPSWKLSGMGILANKARGARAGGSRAEGFISQYSHSTQFLSG